MAEKAVSITIEGGRKTGKSTLVALILRALNQHSMCVEIEDREENKAGRLAEDPTQLERRMRGLWESGLNVTLRVEDLQREG